MARFTFKLPDIGEGIAEAEIVAWHVAVGQRIEEDAPLADMMTDKATVEMESPVAGTVVELAGKPGDAIAIGAMLAVIEVEGEVEEAPAPAATKAAEPAPAPQPAQAPQPVAAPEPAKAEPAPVPVPATPAKPVLASPAVRARAKALGVDLAQVKAEGAHVRHADLDAFLRYGSAQGYRPAGDAARADEAVAVIGLRRRIAENMAAAKRAIPHFSYVEEIEVTALEALRAQLNEGRGGRPKLTLLPFLITAICRAVPEFPMINARYDDDANVVTRHGAVHMGIATQTPGGLMVPVIRDAQGLNIWQLAAEITRLSAAARDGTARREELSGSTLTITSLGPLGGVATTPVINRPEVAIIGPNRIIERPVFVPGSDAVRRAKLMNLSISCDHRVVDGWDAASFVQALRRLIEAPALILAP
ncbi:MAG: 2-oxo acid dehydrogenase subunit E2 [Proteobacteria bacterium]|nr:2-oxo acid dehydrogenase subunit E2 [Pseudomonadota bacterium]